MACVSPLWIKQSLEVSRLGTYDKYKQYLKLLGCLRFDSKGYMYYRVPCGWCLNCRVDKRNWLEDSINYELNHLYQKVGSFVTLTYDNYHILDNIVYTEDLYGNTLIKKDDNNVPLLTVKMSDGTKFIKKLRSYIKYHNLDCPAIRKDFKYVMCTEYGEEKNRCHIHLLMLGIHPKIAYKYLVACWNKGIIDAGFIKNGGIRYIVDYMDKLPKGKQLREQFENVGLEAPNLVHSKGIGRNLIFDNLDYILQNDMCYPCGAFGKNRPIPMYWKKVLFKRNENFEKTIKSIKEKMNAYQIEKENGNYSFSAMNKFVSELAFKEHKKLENKIRNKRNVPPYVIYQEYGNSKKLELQSLADLALYGDIVPF